MIFVTVGTHEQPFNRLIQAIDFLKGEGVITDEVFIQTGYSTYIPQYCEWKKMLSYSEMKYYFSQSDCIVCHGGPSTFMEAVANGKKVVVVPRLKKFDEHVNNHQLDFLQKINEKQMEVCYITDVNELPSVLHSETLLGQYTPNNEKFCSSLSRCIENMC